MKQYRNKRAAGSTNDKTLLRNLRRVRARGFTLFETVIAVGVMTVGGLAVLTLMNQALRTSSLSGELITAVNLAREGTEIVRALRDSSANGYALLNDGNYAVDSGTNFNLNTVVTGGASVHDCANCSLKLDNGRFVHSGTGQATVFNRMITISDEPSGPSCAVGGPVSCTKRITSEVGWLHKGQQKNYTVVVYLTNWR